LAKLGWQVDMFTRKTNPDDEPVVQHSPHCRTIRLVVGPETFIPRDELFEYLSAFVEAFLKFQSKEGTNYPLVHTHYWLSAWIGLQLKQLSNIQLVHTYHSLGTVNSSSVSVRSPMFQTRLAIEQQIFEQANCIVAASLREQEMLQSAFPSHKMRSLFSPQSFIQLAPCNTDKIPKLEAGLALQLSQTYRRLLAQSIMDERLWHLPLPNPGETEVSPVKRPSVTPVESLTLAS
jgi:D-inositol-3-phosphate glycosyltransferase